jgi:hypothetical protein
MRTALVLCVLAVAAPATADPPRARDADAMHTDDCARARKANKPCVIDMGRGEDVEGNGVVATGSAIVALPSAKHPSLLPIRHDFIVEILRSGEDL